MATTSGLNIHHAVEIKQRATHHEKAPCFQYSQEVIQHCNVLRAEGGEAAVRQYLNTIKTLKEQTEMSHSTDMMEAGIRRNEPPAITQVVTGTMEAALQDAEHKANFYESEVQRCSGEASRWREVANGLRHVMSLTTQPLSLVKPRGTNGNGNANGNGEAARRARAYNGNVPTGFWMENIRAILTAPMPRKVLTRALIERSGHDKTRASQAITYCLIHEKLVKVDDNICLPEWLTPVEVSAAAAARAAS